MKTVQLFVAIFLVQTVAGQGFSSWFPSFDQKPEKVESHVVVKTGLPPSPPPTVYEPSKPVVKKEHKEKKEWVEKCNISFSKDDILMLTMVRKDAYSKPTAFTPIILAPETIRFSFRVEKKKAKLATKKLLKTLAFAKIKEDEEKLPISLLLDAKTAALLPVISPDDLFIITIITNKPKKGLKIKSHFVDEISIDQVAKKQIY